MAKNIEGRGSGDNLRDVVLDGISLGDVLQRLGITVRLQGSDQWRCLCPFHEEKEPSFVVDASIGGKRREIGRWVCFHDKRRGSIFDLVEALGHAKGFLNVCEWLLPGSTSGIDRSKPRQQRPVKPPEPKLEERSYLPVPEWSMDEAGQTLQHHDELLDYLERERGINRQVAASLNLGAERIAEGRWHLRIPIWNGWKGIWQAKLIEWPRPDKGRRFLQTKGSGVCVYDPIAQVKAGNPNYRDDAPSPTIIVESELDAILLVQCGLRAVSVGGTTGFSLSNLLHVLRDPDSVLCPDQDEAGQSALQSLGEQCSRHGFKFCVAEPGDGWGKDPGEWWLGHFDRNHDAMTAWFCGGQSRMRAEVVVTCSPDLLQTTLNKDGDVKVRRSIVNLHTILREDPIGARFWMNEMGRTPMCGPRPIEDEDVVDLQTHLSRAYETDWGFDVVWRCVNQLCRERTHHPIREHLRGLEWDGTPRIESMLGCDGGEPIQIDPKQDVELKRIFWRKFLVSAVSRVMKPGCPVHSMLVFYSDQQGIGKSRLCRALCMRPEWFVDEHMDPQDKDYTLTVHRGGFVVEGAEIDAMTRKKDLATVRGFVSRSVDRIRPPYGRSPLDMPRSFVFFGTTNDPGVVREKDGRRYWPIEALSFNHEAIEGMVEQVWAEAVHLFDSGESYWLTESEDQRRREDVQDSFQMRSVVREFLDDWFEEHPEPVWVMELYRKAHDRCPGVAGLERELRMHADLAGIEIRTRSIMVDGDASKRKRKCFCPPGA